LATDARLVEEAFQARLAILARATEIEIIYAHRGYSHPSDSPLALGDLPVAGRTDHVKSDDDRPVGFRSTDPTTTSEETTAPDEVA
jgi:hypothetical protein